MQMFTLTQNDMLALVVGGAFVGWLFIGLLWVIGAVFSWIIGLFKPSGLNTVDYVTELFRRNGELHSTVYGLQRKIGALERDNDAIRREKALLEARIVSLQVDIARVQGDYSTLYVERELGRPSQKALS
jgi:FtsZ-binding cell division protein ZapB